MLANDAVVKVQLTQPRGDIRSIESLLFSSVLPFLSFSVSLFSYTFLTNGYLLILFAFKLPHQVVHRSEVRMLSTQKTPTRLPISPSPLAPPPFMFVYHYLQPCVHFSTQTLHLNTFNPMMKPEINHKAKKKNNNVGLKKHLRLMRQSLVHKTAEGWFPSVLHTHTHTHPHTHTHTHTHLTGCSPYKVWIGMKDGLQVGLLSLWSKHQNRCFPGFRREGPPCLRFF